MSLARSSALALGIALLVNLFTLEIPQNSGLKSKLASQQGFTKVNNMKTKTRAAILRGVGQTIGYAAPPQLVTSSRKRVSAAEALYGDMAKIAQDLRSAGEKLPRKQGL